MTLATLYELLCEAAPPIDQVKQLLQEHSGELLRTLETAPSADQRGGSGAAKRHRSVAGGGWCVAGGA